MTQEDKKLLLTDLCARLPYHPIVYVDENLPRLKLGVATRVWEYIAVDKPCKPYLRSMSSMTEKEDNERKQLGILCAIKGNGNHERIFDGFGNEGVDTQLKALDWLNAHHFDFRNLIERGLVIKAPADMYKID